MIRNPTIDEAEEFRQAILNRNEERFLELYRTMTNVAWGGVIGRLSRADWKWSSGVLNKQADIDKNFH